MSGPDARVNPFRPDLAAGHLRGKVEAARFVEGSPRGIVAPSAPLRRRPAADAPLETEALQGEDVVVYDEADGWSWAQLTRDSYVGYLPSAALGPARATTHRVAALRTHAYPGPSIKRPPRARSRSARGWRLSNSPAISRSAADGLHYFARHLAPEGSFAEDFVAVAERFLETPYLWGGRTSEGIDCSGLVQTALTAAGVAAPRDSDMMEARLGSPLAADAPLQRGDLVFWRGHVGVMRDGATLLHANGWHMRVVSEPLAEARARIAANGGGAVTSSRRL